MAPLAALLALLPAWSGATFSPVLGVLAMPEFKPHPSQPKRSYMAASYVKWLEASGAHVVPLAYDAPHSVTTMLLGKVNGIIFPGGLFPSAKAYEDFSRLVFETGVKERIPMWGECLGLLQLLLFTSGQPSPGPVTKGWDALGPPPMLARLNLTAAGAAWAPVAQMPPELQRGLVGEPWAWHSHGYSVGLEAFERNKQLVDFWDLIAVGQDRQGAPFVDIIQAKGLPIYATMWHPEKNTYEFMPERLGMYNASQELPFRSAQAARAMGDLSSFFVEACRENSTLRFTQEELGVWSVHNWAPDHTGSRDSVFEEIIYFPATHQPRPPPIAGGGAPLLRWHRPRQALVGARSRRLRAARRMDP